MRILLVSGSYPPMKCGVGAYTQKLAIALSSNSDCKVMVLTDIRADSGRACSDVDVHPTIINWTIWRLAGIVREIRRLRPDLVHVQYPTQGYNMNAGAYLLPIALRFMGFPCIQTWHEPVLGWRGLVLAQGLNSLIVVKRDIKRYQSAVVNWMLRKKRLNLITSSSMLPAVHLTEDARRSIKNKYARDDEWLLVFYGFLAPLKGLETLLEVVSQTRSKLVLACDIRTEDAYHRKLVAQIDALQIGAKFHIAGFLQDEELAALLGSADAAVFPFAEGAADWNTSIDGAIAQGVFVLTTTKGESVYDQNSNTYRAQINAANEMIAALNQYAGRRSGIKPAGEAWKKIATEHHKVYLEANAQ